MKEIYRIIGPNHKGWSRNVDKELGNYDYLLGADVSIVITPASHGVPGADASNGI